MARIKTMNFSVDPITKETTVVRIGDHLDFRNASDFKVILKDQVRQGARIFILDFSDTELIDSTGLGSLFNLYRQLARLNGTICFASASGAVKLTVELTRLYKAFPQFPTVETARKAVRTLVR